jgi:hypothetical protein
MISEKRTKIKRIIQVWNGPSAKTARPLSKGNRTGAGQKPGTMLEIVTLNIEGTKGNSPYLKHLY